MSDSPRFLFGPVDDPDLLDRTAAPRVAEGRWAAFPAACPSYSAAAAWFGPGEEPAAILWWPGYTSMPAWLPSAPVPLLAVAHDPNLLWHQYREQLAIADLVLTDLPSAERFRRAGFTHAWMANLYGLDRHFLADLDRAEGERDIDILFVGNLNPAVQSERLPWLGRLARLADRWRVRIVTGVRGAEYRALLRRAKVCFNRSIRGEFNLRTFEAAASGCVLFQENDHAEIPYYLTPGIEFVSYGDDDLEERLERILGDDAERQRLAERAKRRCVDFATLVESAAGVGGSGWPMVLDRAAKRMADPPRLSIPTRIWQRTGLAGPDADRALAGELMQSGEHHGLGLLAGDPTRAESHFRRAAESGNRVSRIAHGDTLAALGRREESTGVLRAVLADLTTRPLTREEADTCPYPVAFDHLRVRWERAGWDHPDDPVAEAAVKLRLLVCKVQSLLAEQTQDLDAYCAASEACPEIPTVRAACGCALARFADAEEHLRAAVTANPFDEQAARAWLGTLLELGRTAEAEQLRADRECLARALGRTPAAPAMPTLPASPKPNDRLVTLTRDAFGLRFGTPDTAAALCGFTPAHDTHVVLALLAHARARRILEIGTASGQMTANLTAWSPADATIVSLGIVAGASSGASEQGYEIPPRAEYARHADHFGTAHKAFFVTADSRSYDFARLAPLDFAYVDGGHDFETVRSDSIKCYEALRTGGCLVWHDYGSRVAWVKVREAIESLGFPEPLHHVAGTEVAFLFKGDGLGATAGPDLPKVAVAWDGEFTPVHSLAAVNRAICGELLARGQEVMLTHAPMRTPAGSEVALAPDLLAAFGRDGRATTLVRHRWPPDFTPPGGHESFVLMQPWEFGRIPREWVEPILDRVDEVWAYTRSVERTYVSSGIPADRVHVVPPGVDSDRFRPGLAPLPLATRKPVKFLFVGGTIPRKGIDVLLAAYRAAFTAADEVCLVVKEFGAGTFYRGNTAEARLAAHRADPNAPAIEYLTADLTDEELPRLYATCDVLVSAYRGEGFALPVLEAMACGKPVVVTAGGPTDDFVPPAAGWRVPARVSYLEENGVGLPTAGRAWWLEPDVAALAAILKAVAGDSAERLRRGEAARAAALGWTWARTAAVVEDRLRALRNKTPIRFRRPAPIAPPAPAVPHAEALTPFIVTSDISLSQPAVPRGMPRVSLTMIVKNEESNLAACLTPLRGLVDEMIVVDTGSTDRTRDIARYFGAQVSKFAWVDSFSAARNAALDRATGDWIFWMDGDDRLDPANAAKLKSLFGSLTHENAAFVFKCVCVSDGPGGTATAVDHVRLFRRDPQHRWKYRVHEQILPSLRQTGATVRWSDVAVHHVGYVDADLRKRKLARDLRLLELERVEQPDDPFTLFNLGSVYNELGDIPAAIAALDASLSRSHPKDSIVRKLYALLTQCQRRTGDLKGALERCRAGRAIYPDDAELLFIESNLLKDNKDVRGAEDRMLQLIRGRDEEHFGSVDTGLRGHKARHNLACLYYETGRYAEAESQWRAALVDDPAFVPAHLGLGELYLRQRNWSGVDRTAADLRQFGPLGEAEAESLLGRSFTARGEHATARDILESAVARFPGSVPIRVAYSYALLEGGFDPLDAEAALRDVLKLDPENAQAKRNLEALYRNTGRWVQGMLDADGAKLE
jgi:glycosyltransferase involved in cell wall biosynthesis/tetratricopeptide (TPR) repeat protein